jgi:hypothetical protein
MSYRPTRDTTTTPTFIGATGPRPWHWRLYPLSPDGGPLQRSRASGRSRYGTLPGIRPKQRSGFFVSVTFATCAPSRKGSARNQTADGPAVLAVGPRAWPLRAMAPCDRPRSLQGIARERRSKAGPAPETPTEQSDRHTMVPPERRYPFRGNRSAMTPVARRTFSHDREIAERMGVRSHPSRASYGRERTSGPPPSDSPLGYVERPDAMRPHGEGWLRPPRDRTGTRPPVSPPAQAWSTVRTCSHCAPRHAPSLASGAEPSPHGVNPFPSSAQAASPLVPLPKPARDADRFRQSDDRVDRRKKILRDHGSKHEKKFLIDRKKIQEMTSAREKFRKNPCAPCHACSIVSLRARSSDATRVLRASATHRARDS